MSPSITAEWDIPFLLTTTQGTLPFNSVATVGSGTVGYYMLDPAKCATGTAPRVTRTNVPQGDGEIIHRKYKTGYAMELNVQLWDRIGDEGMPACGAVLRQMIDHLMLHLNACFNVNARIQWTPSADPPGSLVDRMLNNVRLLGPSGGGGGSFVSIAVEKTDDGPLVSVTFAFLTGFPYAMDAPETTTPLGGSSLVAVTNVGNTEFFPVFKVYGSTSAFTLVNHTNIDEQGNAKKIVYKGPLLPGGVSIGGSDHAEIDTFRNTIYLNGSSSNLKPGVDILRSDFWGLLPGVNSIECDGASADMLWQAAYA